VLLAGCGDDSPKTITNIREGPATTDFKPSSTAERLGFTRGGQQMNPHHGMQAAGGGGFEYTTPDGWEERNPPGQMREVDFLVTRDPQIECYVSVVQGGIAANVLRWRKQMELEPITPAAVAGLPKEEFLGQSAVLVDLEGTFVGMGRSAPRPGSRMLGLLVEEPGRTVTLKMTGPAASVAEEREHFLALAKSFHSKEAPAAAAAPEGGQPFAWDAPPEWELREGHPMRVVTFAPKGSEGTECYVTILSGGAGGVAANMQRWRDQMAQPQLTVAELDALKTVQVLGHDAKMIEINGSYTDMAGNKVGKASLLGVVCQLPEALVTVKMTGPTDVVEKEKDRFLAFCGSLRMP